MPESDKNLLIRSICATILLFTIKLSYAIPINLQLTIDEPTRGLAVLSGVMDQNLFPRENNAWKWQNFEVTGEYWWVNFAMFWDKEHEYYFVESILAQHLDAPHPGEVDPGLIWQLTGAGSHFNDGDAWFNSIPAAQIHPGSMDHYDLLSFHVDDLNGSGSGFMDSFNQFSATITLTHRVPEPPVLLLLLPGLLILVLRKKTPHRTGHPID